MKQCKFLLVFPVIFFSVITFGQEKFDVENNEKALFRAVEEGDLNAFEKLMANRLDINARDDYGDTALMVAIYQEKLEIASKLIDAGADVNVRDEHGDTALMIILLEEEKGILGKKLATLASKLIDAGADLSVVNEEGKSVLTLIDSWGDFITWELEDLEDDLDDLEEDFDDLKRSYCCNINAYCEEKAKTTARWLEEIRYNEFIEDALMTMRRAVNSETKNPVKKWYNF